MDDPAERMAHWAHGALGALGAWAGRTGLSCKAGLLSRWTGATDRAIQVRCSGTRWRCQGTRGLTGSAPHSALAYSVLWHVTEL